MLSGRTDITIILRLYCYNSLPCLLDTLCYLHNLLTHTSILLFIWLVWAGGTSLVLSHLKFADVCQKGFSTMVKARM